MDEGHTLYVITIIDSDGNPTTESITSDNWFSAFMGTQFYDKADEEAQKSWKTCNAWDLQSAFVEWDNTLSITRVEIIDGNNLSATCITHDESITNNDEAHSTGEELTGEEEEVELEDQSKDEN